MARTPTIEQCRRRLIKSAEATGTIDHFVSATTLSVFDVQTGTTYREFLEQTTRNMTSQAEYKTVTPEQRIANVRLELGCLGVKNGVCCLESCIQLIPAEVNVEVIRGLGPSDDDDDDEVGAELIVG